MNDTQGAELTVRELLQKRNVSNGDTQRADGRIYQAVVDSQKNAKIVEWVEIRDGRQTDEEAFKHTCFSAASIIVCIVVVILMYFVVKAINK